MWSSRGGELYECHDWEVMCFVLLITLVSFEVVVSLSFLCRSLLIHPTVVFHLLY